MIEPSLHPSKVLIPAWIDLLRSEADKATAAGRLTARQLKLFYDQGWFKALVPKAYGGLQWPLAQVVRFEEAIGWTEGSAGWVFTLCSGAGWFGGYLDPAIARRIFSTKKACLAGSGAVGGVGKTNKNGQILIKGQWQYATGAPHATAYTANVFLEKEKQVRAFLFMPEEVTLKKTWYPIGLTASASESFSVARLSVVPDRSFEIHPDRPFIQGSLYRMPFGALAEATIAANLSGMALHFMEEVEKLWIEKAANKPLGASLPVWMAGARQLLSTYYQKWPRARTALWKAVTALETFVDRHMTVEQLSLHTTYLKKSAAVSKMAQAQAALCREIVVTLYPYTGLTGASAHSAIGKVWRDFQTGSQHALFVPAASQRKGRPS